jgi:hypothetical protein
MKGKKHIKIGRRNIVFKFDLNALEAFTEEAGVDLGEIDSALNKVSNIKIFIKALSVSGETPLTDDEIGKMDFSTLNEVFALVRESTGNLNTPK